MQLKWGAYSFDANGVKVTSSSETVLNMAKQPYALRQSIECDGWLAGSGQSDLTDKMSALQTALRTPYRDLILYQDDGTPSATLLTNATSISGVVIVSGPHFPDAMGPEYTTLRRFKFTAQAEYPLPTANNMLISWRERMVFAGGGPVYVMKRAVNGPPQRQMVWPQTEYTATQSGEAVGYLKYPDPPPARWPNWLKESPNLGQESPDRIGKKFQNFKITWEYKFEALVPLVGSPTVWPN